MSPTATSQLTEHWSNGGISPYNMYDGWLNSTLASGSAAVGDYERLNDPALNADLATLAGATTAAADHRPRPASSKYVAGQPADHPGHHGARSGSSTTRRTTPAGPRQANPYDSGQPSGTNNGPGSGTDEVVVSTCIRRSLSEGSSGATQSGPALGNPPTGGGPHPKIPNITLAQPVPGSYEGRPVHELTTAHCLQHPGLPGCHPGLGRLARPPLGLCRHRAPAHRRRAHRPVDARR